MNRKILYGLSVAVVFQLLVLTGMYASAALPLWTGSEVKIKTLPVDPRSMFRGNYARLNYDISRIERHYFSNNEELRNGEVVYVVLKAGEDGLYQFSGAQLDKPESGTFLRGRIQNRRYNLGNLQIRYGIEAFFAPKADALQLEADLRNGGIAVLMVARSGKARLKDVIGKNAGE